MVFPQNICLCLFCLEKRQTSCENVPYFAFQVIEHLGAQDHHQEEEKGEALRGEEGQTKVMVEKLSQAR